MVAGSNLRLVVIGQPGMSEVDDFVARFDGDASVEVEVALTESPDEVDAAVADAVERGVDCVASVGGDGSNNLVVAALIRAGSDAAFAPVPAGTVNLVAQVLGIDDGDASAHAIRERRTRLIDLGATEQGIFVMNTSTGFDAAVIDDADDHGDARFGRLSFVRAGLRRLRRESGEQVRVEANGEVVYDGRATSVIVMNVGQRASDSLQVAPDAEPDDGVLDVMVVRVDNVRRMMLSAVRLALRRDVPDRDVVRGRGERIEIEWAREVPSQRDGDADEAVRSLTATCLPGALRIHHGSLRTPSAHSKSSTGSPGTW
ncbi:MAG: diacylglycerol kinase family protein [Ilumatobacter sp.]|uniref:diacylglycerol/lipid kinase family protein n=1 Tax=Ilumatobacter sp. TaxID=1967498 RepID=UPI003C76FAFA